MGRRNAAILPLLLTLGFGCQLEGRTSEEAQAAPSTGPQPVMVEAGARPTAIPLDIWSADAKTMVGLDVAVIRKSPLGTMFESLLLKNETGLLPSKTACQRKFLDAIDTMLLIQGSDKEPSRSVTVVHGLTRSAVEACVAAKSTDAARKFGANYGALGDDPVKELVWWHDAETFLIASDGKSTLERARPNQERGATNLRLMKTIAKVDTSAAVWMASVEPPAGMSDSISEFRGSIRLKDSLNAIFRVQYDNAESAAEAAKDTKKTLDGFTPFSKYFEESRVRAEGSLLMFDLAATQKQVAEFAQEPIFAGAF